MPAPGSRAATPRERVGSLGSTRLSASLRSFLGRVGIAFVVCALVAASGIVWADALWRKGFEDSRKVQIDDLEAVEPGAPANYLLIGSDTRAFVDNAQEAESFGSAEEEGGQRSDVMMVLHVEPETKTGMLVSFPRDLVVDIPGHGKGLLNSAFNLGGPELVIQTLEENFPPLRLNHYIEVDFNGFRDIVNAIGKVKLSFPTAAHDEFTGLHVDEAGCVALDGDGALAYARSRHYNIPLDPANPAPWEPRGESKQSRGWKENPRADLDRIPRQQYFLRTLAQTALDKTADDPRKLIGLLDSVQKSFARDEGLTFDEMKALVRTFKDLDPARVQMITLPVEAGTGRWSANLFATQEADAVASRLMFFPDRVQPKATEAAPADVTVRIVNASGDPAVGARAIDDFASAGFDVVGPLEEADRVLPQTQLRYAPGEESANLSAIIVSGTLNVTEVVSQESISRESPRPVDVMVIVGQDYDTLEHRALGGAAGPATTAATAAGAGGPTTTEATTTTTTTTVAPLAVDPNFVPVAADGGPLVGCPDD